MNGIIAGEIYNPQENIHIEWEIPNYFSFPQKADNYLESPPFSFLNAIWRLILWPNGQRSNNTVGLVSLYLKLESSTSSYDLSLKCGIRYIFVEFNQADFTFNEFESSHGFNLCSRMDLHRSQRSFLPGDLLTVYLEAKSTTASNSGVACQTSLDTAAALCHDFQALLKSEQSSDVTFKVQDFCFRAHKLILETRSPVFAAMFEHEMAEKNDGVVKIIDCDSETFREFLQYLYTGLVENLSWNNVIGLFITADKYCTQELKEQCMEFMKENLSVETVCDVIVAADTHNEAVLKTAAETFLVENIKAVILTDKWKKLLAENYSLGGEILMKVLPGDLEQM